MRLGMVSTYSPRRCAVAAFATDLGRALSPEFDLVVCALDRYGLSYPPEVAAVIGEDERDDYRRAARVLAEHEVDAVLIQYDDSSFGGPHVLDLAHELRRFELPYVVVLHSEREDAGADLDMTTAALTAGAQRVLVFTERAQRGLPSRLGLNPAAVERVPVGVPSAEASSGRAGHAATGPVLTWIGPLTTERGFDTAMAAAAAVRAVHPATRLVAVGRPVTEADRNRTGVELVQGRLSPLDLAALLARTDVMLAPTRASGRSWSAILTAAVAAGVPVVAPRYPYAEELLAGGAGTIVEPGDPEATAAAALNLLLPRTRSTQHLTWPAVVDQYARVLRAAAQPTARAGCSAAPLRLDRVRPPAGRDPQSWARLAVVLADPGMSTRDSRTLSWLDRSVTSLAAAAAAADDPDATGWALWGLSAVAHGSGVPPALARRARQLRAMVAALAAAPTARPTLTADAYAVLGLTQDAAVDGCAATVLHAAADRLNQAGRASGRGTSWPWFSDRLDVAPGARLPQAMIAAGRWLGDPSMLHCGLTSLDWYARRAGLGAAAAQLRLPTPLAESAADAGAVVEALVEAHQASGATRPARLALTAFAWFHGGNRYGTAVYDPDLGVAAPVLAAGECGPMTAVGPDGTLAYLGALLRLTGAGLLELPSLDPTRHHLAAA